MICTIWHHDCCIWGHLKFNGTIFLFLRAKNETSKILKIHYKKHGFGNMRLPNWAKMEPQNNIFSSAKIIRIHCKTHTSAPIPAEPLLINILFFMCFSKNYIFQNPPFRLDGNTIFEVYSFFCSWLLHVCFTHFLCSNFGLKNDISNIIKIHCKTYGFGNMWLPDGAKLEPKSGLLLSVKIIRIHCKTHTSAPIPAKL